MNIFDRLEIHPPAKTKILVIEDDPGFRHLVTQHLLSAGFLVHDFAGIEHMPGESSTACTGDIHQEIDLSQYEIAFLDHYFQSRTDNGTTLTKTLIKLGVTVIGMSSSASANDSMVRQGALVAFQKREFREILLKLGGYH